MDVLLRDVGTRSPREEAAVLDALSPDDADTYLDTLRAAGWTVVLGARDYDLVPPRTAPVGSSGAAHGLN